MTFRILNFCGGGVRGLMSAMILKRLDDTFRLRHPGLTLVGQADMIAGTSTGASITGLLLAGLSPALVVDFYHLVTIPAFKRAGTSPDKPALGATSGLIEALDKVGLGHWKLDPMLSSLKKRALFTSFDIGNATRPWAPLLFHNFPGSPTQDAQLLDAMMASGSMPGMTAPYPYVLDGEPLNLLDGAFVHHDPTVPAVALAAAGGNDVSGISAIDIGTGFMQNYITADTSSWGSDQWISAPGGSAGQLPGLLLNTPPLPQMPFLNLCLNGTSTNLMPDLAGMLLGDRFAYLNPNFGTQYVPENATDPASLQFLEQMAENCDLTAALEVLDKNWV